jgi:hypothetical protein
MRTMQRHKFCDTVHKHYPTTNNVRKLPLPHRQLGEPSKGHD